MPPQVSFMERYHRNSEILVIDRNPFDLAEAQQWLEEGFTHVEVVTSLKSGLERLLSANIGFIVCNLELVESNEKGGPCVSGGASAENEKKLLNLGIPIVFLSVGQQADVVFKPIEGLSSPSFFCLKKYVCVELFPTIVELAIKTAYPAKHVSPNCPCPHIIMPDVLHESMHTANIHTMY